MSWTAAPALLAILADADRVAPGRSHASDGTIGDPAHAASKSDHNPDFRGIVHACDVTNDPGHGMDTWHWAQVIAGRMMLGQETRVEYLVSFDGNVDVIFHPSVSLAWRQNGSAKQEHRSHLHVSIKYSEAAENDVRPFFVTAITPPPPKPPVLLEDDDMPTIFYNGTWHSFWLDNAGHLLHQFQGTKGHEDLNKKLEIAELFDVSVPISAKVTPDGKNITVRGRSANSDRRMLAFDFIDGRWSAAAVSVA